VNERPPIDDLGRTALLGIAAARVAIGAGALFASRPALRALGFPQPGATANALAKLAGGRDIALGALALLARDEPALLRTTGLVAAAVDAADALTFGFAARRKDGIGQAGLLGAVSGSAAAIGGLWAAHRLRPSG
jgi:hypothetical protein